MAPSGGAFVRSENEKTPRRLPQGLEFSPVENSPGAHPNHPQFRKPVAAENVAAKVPLRKIRRPSGPAVIVARIRHKQITTLVLDRHQGPCLTDEGQRYFDVMVVHIAIICGGEGFDLAAEEWAMQHTPKLSAAYVAEGIDSARRAGGFYASRDIGRYLNVTLAEHDRLRLTHVTPSDVSSAEFKRYRNERAAARRKVERLKTGKTKTPHELSASQLKPWIAAGFNTRKTWERHGKPMPGSNT
jgi:hypothetical protein